jgi:probable phosphoglycerate mutase
LLIRHGETALNVQRVLQPADTPLSPQGQAQALALGQRLAGMGGVAVLSSDLPRALQTAQCVAAACGLPLATSALLQERNFGDWRGRAHDSLGVDPKSGLRLNPLTVDLAPPGGESALVFAQRAARAFDWVLAERARVGGLLAVVTHGLVLREMMAGPLAASQAAAPAHWANTGLSIVDAAPPHRVQRVNCTAHLDGSSQDDARALSGG